MTKKEPKVALVHDWLNTKLGGGEQVLLDLAELYADAPIYTLLLDADKYRGKLDLSRIRTSNLQKWPAVLRKRSRYLLPFAPKAIEGFDLSGYDIVICTSSAFAGGVITGPKTYHLSYCFSPMRYVWDYWPRYLQEQNVGPLRRAAIHYLTSRLRLWDYYASKRVNSFVAISQTVSARIYKYYGRPSHILYPPVDITPYDISNKQVGDYYVTLAALTPYKKIDLAIEACQASGRKLVVIGEGSDRARLETLAGPTIQFVGRVSTEEKARLLTAAKGLIFANEEDFGIAPVEALAAGTPVIAYKRGGVTETVTDRVTGLFFSEQSTEALKRALDEFEKLTFDPKVLHKSAEIYDSRQFGSKFSKLVEKGYREYIKKNS